MLIHHLLEDEPTWLAWWALDDATPSLIEPVDAETVRAAGVAWLLADSSAGDGQPFSATLQLAASRDALASYQIRFGDQAVGLGPNPAAERVRRGWPDVEEWIFEWAGPVPA